MTDTAFYNRMAAMATRLITKFGKPVTVRSWTGTSRDVETGSVTRAPVDTVVNGVYVDITKYQATDSLIERGDKMMFIDGPATTDDRIIDGSTEIGIVGVEKVDPGGVPVVWRVQVRK